MFAYKHSFLMINQLSKLLLINFMPVVSGLLDTGLFDNKTAGSVNI